MRILTRYLAREITGPFIFGVAAFTAIMVGFTLISISQSSLPISGPMVIKLTLLTVPENLALAFPMGILLGTLFTLGRLSGHSEVVAMRAGGLSGARLLVPFVIFGVLASFASLYLTQETVPYARHIYASEMSRIKGHSSSLIRRQILPPEFDSQGRLKRLIYVDEFDLKNLYLRGVYIDEYSAGQLRYSIHANEMTWNGEIWEFRQGRVITFGPDGRVSRLVVRGGTAAYQPLLPKPQEMAAEATTPANMNWQEFRAFIGRRARAGENVRRFLVELYTRVAIPFACLALALVGTPLGVQSHRAGSAMSFGLAIAVIFIYFFLLSIGQVLGRTGILPPVIAAWSANIILCGVGVGLFFARMR